LSIIQVADAPLIQALLSATEPPHPFQLESSVIVSMFEHGLLETIFDNLSFPKAIDDPDTTKPQKVMLHYPNLLSN